MKKYLAIGLISLVLSGCISNQYKLDSNLESSKYTQVIVNDFITGRPRKTRKQYE